MRITDSSNKGNGLLAKNDHFNLPTTKASMYGKTFQWTSHMHNHIISLYLLEPVSNCIIKDLVPDNRSNP